MLERERRDLHPERHLQVVTRDQGVELPKRAVQLGLDARVEVARRAGCVEDPLGGKIVKKCGAARQPVAVRAQATDDPLASTRDFAASRHVRWSRC